MNTTIRCVVNPQVSRIIDGGHRIHASSILSTLCCDVWVVCKPTSGNKAEISDGDLFDDGGDGNVKVTEGIAVDRQARQIDLHLIGESQALDAAQATDGNAADNEDGGETGGIARVLGTNVGSGIVSTEIETHGTLGHRQGRPKPENWNVMTKRQRRNWYMHKND